MKSLNKVLQIVEKFSGNIPVEETRKLLIRSVKLADNLEDNLKQAVEMLASIRYTDWVTKGFGIGLSSESMDELIQSANKVLKSVKR